MELIMPFASAQIIFILLISVFVTSSIFSQNFVQLPDVELKCSYPGFVSLCDYNSDNFIDVVITGSDYANQLEHVEFYKNNGDKTFAGNVFNEDNSRK
jgi:hypothetical protein